MNFKFLINFWNCYFNKKEKKPIIPPVIVPPTIIEPPIVKPLEPIIPQKDFSAVVGKGAFLYDLNPLYAEFKPGINNWIKSLIWSPQPEIKIRKTSKTGSFGYMYEDPLVRYTNQEIRSAAGIASWLKSLGMNNVWMRIIGRAGWSSSQTKAQAKNFIEECNKVGIKVGAWGYMYNDPPEKYANYVVEFVKEFGFNTFIHNAEIEWEKGSRKEMEALAVRYWKVINDGLPSNIVHGLSTFWNTEYHPSMPWTTFMNNCDVIAPQLYHVVKEPISMLKKGIQLNSKFNKPIVATTQFFYGEMGITEQSATKDVNIICQKWNIDLKDIILNNKVIGFNHWYCGGRGTHAFNTIMREEYKNFNPILADI